MGPVAVYHINCDRIHLYKPKSIDTESAKQTIIIAKLKNNKVSEGMYGHQTAI